MTIDQDEDVVDIYRRKTTVDSLVIDQHQFQRKTVIAPEKDQENRRKTTLDPALMIEGVTRKTVAFASETPDLSKTPTTTTTTTLPKSILKQRKLEEKEQSFDNVKKTSFLTDQDKPSKKYRMTTFIPDLSK